MFDFNETAGNAVHRLRLRLSGQFPAFLGLVFALALFLAPQFAPAASSPVITGAPEKRTVFEGDTHTFTVVATGTDPLAYQWRHEGTNLPGKTGTSLLLANVQTNDAGFYSVVVTNLSGSVTSSPALLTVRRAGDPRYPAPQGGWAYLFDGNSAASSFTASLDGTWNRNNGLDSWDGLGRGAGNGLPGGIDTTNGILTIEDAIVANGSGSDNRRFYLTRDLNQETQITNTSTLLNDGVTLTFRARLTPPTDPLIEITNAPNGWVNTNDGKGIFGIRQSGASGMLVSFSLNRTIEDIGTNTTFSFAQAGLHMNNLNGNSRSSFVDPGEPGTLSLLPLDPSVFHEFWITIRDNGTAPGTHAVTIYLDGASTGVVFNVTAGIGSDAPFANYLALGLGSGPERGAVDVDFLGYAPGALAPPGFNEPVGFLQAPSNVTIPLNEIATFQVGITGTPPYAIQWYKNGSILPNATNSIYSTPPMTAGEDGSLFTVVVTNAINSITSSPPAVLSLLRPPTITSPPQSLTVTNGDPAAFTVGFTSQDPAFLQWRFNGSNLPGENNSTLTLPSASPSNAGNYDVVLTNSGGAITSAVAVLTVRVLDFGDAPDPSYATLKAGNGARHVIVPGIYLGTRVDMEVDATPNATATGDDLDGTDDEDGVSFTTLLRAGQSATLEVVASTNGLLNAWIDFNSNGNWAQPGEQIFTNTALLTGTNVLVILIPPAAVPGDTFARFRFNTAGGLSFDGPAANGEVEDYLVSIKPVIDLIVTQRDTPDPAAAGSNVIYSITVSNAGPSTAGAVAFTNTLPAGITFVSATSSQGSCLPSPGKVTCSLNSIAPQANATITIVVTPLAQGSLTNIASVVSSEIDLNPANDSATETTSVLAPPAITAQPQSLTVTNGDNLTFDVTATGAQPLFYQWRKNGNNIPGATGTSLSVANAQPASAGDYSVHITNSVGAVDSQTAVLTVLVPPAITSAPQSRTNLAGSIATFSVTATGTAPFSYQWFYNTTTALPAETNATLSLTNVQTSQAGSYHVRVSNAAGVVASAAATLSIVEMDFGDAPEPAYPTTLANNGARHRLVPGVRLGSLVDFEADGQPHATASGDDSNGALDEDGVLFVTPALVGQISTVSIQASTSGRLDAWFDFNRINGWSDPGDQIFTNTPLVAGPNLLQFRVPLGASNGLTFARFRFSTAGVLSFVGEAPDGEVEDYAVVLGNAVDLIGAQTGPVDPLIVGSNVTLLLSVTNAGPSSATEVTVTNTLPPGLAFVSVISSQGNCANDGSVVSCALNTLASNASATITLQATILAAGSLTNSARFSAVETDLVSGDNSAAFTLRAFSYPVVTTPPLSLTVTNGDPAAFSIAATGTALRYQWQLNNIDIPDATNVTFSISSAQTNHAGSYRVRLSNEVAVVFSPPAILTVLVPASILAQPQDLERIADQTALFSVSASGSAPLLYQWQFDSQDLINETNATLTLLNVQSSQAGLYRVRVSNLVRTVTSDAARLVVISPPSITTQPQSRTNFAGTSVSFTAAASGTLPLHYQWVFNESTLLIDETNLVLSLTNLQSSQGGRYTVLVTNTGGSITSTIATLTVIEADFGDAPQGYGYPTLLAFNGAWHRILPGVHLGTAIDFETDGQPDTNAKGDDLAGAQDEDGVAFMGPLLLGNLTTVSVTASTNGFIDAWIDFNANGSWLESGEQICNSTPVSAGLNLLTFTVPPDAALTNTFARFRFSTAGGLAFDGPAPDGEVEDYAVSILPSFDVAVTLVDFPDPVLVTSNVTLLLTVTNRGPSPVADLMLTNTLPVGMQFLSALASQGACSNRSGQLTCPIGALAPNAGATVTVQLLGSRPGNYMSSVIATAPGNDTLLANNVATQITAVVIAPVSFSNPSIIPIADPTGVDPGLASPYPSTITVSGLTGVVFKVTVTLNNLSHTFPGDLDFLLVCPTGQQVMLMSDAGGGIDIQDATVTFDDDAAAFLPSSGFILSSSYRPTNLGADPDVFPPPAPAGPYAAALSAFRGNDANGVWSLYAVDDASSDSGFIGSGWRIDISTAEPIADLALAIHAAPNPAGLGSNVTCSVAVSNLGPSAATGIRLLDPLPPDMSFVSASIAGGDCNLVGGNIQCDLTNLNPNSVALATIVLQGNSPGLRTNAVSVTAAEIDFPPSNNLARTTLATLPVNDLVLTHSASTNRLVLGNRLTYTLGVTNIGPAPAAHVVLVDRLPDGVLFISANSDRAACTNNGSDVICDFASLAPGTGGTALIVIEPSAIGFVTNRASVASDEIDSSALDNASQIVTPVNVIADVAVTLSASPNPIAAFSNLTCSITISNAGSGPANGVRLASTLPSNVTFISAASTLGDCANIAGVLRCTLGSMAEGQAAFIQLVVSPQTTGSLPIQVQLDSDSFDPVPANNIANAAIAVEQSPIVTAGPQSQTVLNGTNVTLSVSATGFAPLRYQWQFNGTDIPNATNATLILPGVTPAQQGSYRAQIENPVGATLSTSAVLRVLVPPQISDVADVTVDEDNETAPLNFTISDFETPAAALTVTASSSNQQLVPLANIRIDRSTANPTVQVSPATNQSGTALITLEVRDADNLTASDSFVITVLPINDTPTLSALSDATTFEDSSLSIPFIVGDEESPPSALTVTATSTNTQLLPPGALSLSATNGTNYLLTILPATNQAGIATITVTVTDTNGASVSNSFSLTVVSVNDPPTLDPIADIDIDEDSGPRIVILNNLSAGPPNEVQTFAISASSGNPAILPHPSVAATNGSPTAVLTLIPQPNQNGDVAITVNIDDGGGSNNIVTRIFTVHVHGLNDPPAISDITPQSTPEDTMLAVNFTVADLDTGASSISLSAASSNTNLVPVENLSFSGPGSARQLQLLPATNDFGSTTITITVRDPEGATASVSFPLTVTPVNDPPTLELINDVNLIENAGPQIVPLTGISGGPANESQSVAITTLSSDPTFIEPTLLYTNGNSFGALHFTPPANRTGSVVITVTANDGEALNNTVTRNFHINVTAFDRPPSISALADVVTLEDVPVSIPFSVQDLETPLAALLLTVSSSDTNIVPASGLSLTGSGAVRLLQMNPATNRFGSTTISISVTDTNGGTASRSFLLTVNPVNDPPVLSGLANVATRENAPVTLGSISVTDIESPPGSISLTARSSNINLVPDANISSAGPGSTRSITLMPATNQFGTALITVTATDLDGGATTGTFTLSVAPVNDPPTLAPLNTVTVNEDTGIHAIPLSGISAGPANEPQLLAFTVSTTDPALLTALTISYVHPQSTGLLSFATAPDAAGTATITVTLDDGGASNNIASRTFTVIVNPTNDPPLISEINPQSTPEDVPRIVAFTISDDTTPAPLLGLSAVSSDTNIVPQAGISFGGAGNNRTISLSPATNAFGTTTITITVTDTNNSSSTRAFVLTVNPVNDPPVLSTPPNQTITTPTNLVTIPFIIGDVETLATALTLSAASANTAFLPNASLAFGGAGSNRTLLVTLPASQSGSSTLSISVKDVGGLSSTRSFLLTVTLPNQAPTLSGPGNQNADEDSVITLPVTVGDVETPAMNLDLIASSSNTNLVAPGGISLGGTGLNRILSLSPVPNQTGVTTITLIVTDAGGARATNSFQVTFQPVNDPPTLNPIANISTNKNPGPITINISGISAGAGESQSLTVTAFSSAPALIPNPIVTYSSPASNGILVLNPAVDALGTVTITVLVDDAGSSNNLVARSFSVSLNPTSYAPSISAISPQQVNEDTPLAVSFTISDADSTAAALTLSASSTNTTLVANTNIFFEGNGAARTATLIPSRDQFGVTLITIGVSDGTSTTSTSFVLTVNAVNDPPTLNPISNFVTDSGTGNPSYTIPINGISAGPANETQALSVTTSSTGSLPTPTVSYTSPNASATLTLRPGNHVTGSSLVTVTVNDNAGSNSTVSRTFIVNVKDSGNTVPTLSIIPAQTTPENSTLGPINFTVRDAESAASSLTVIANSSNPALLPTNRIVLGGSSTNRTLTLTPIANQSGLATVSLTVTDPSFGLSNMNFNVTVTHSNNLPSIGSIADRTVGEDTLIGPLAFTVSDLETPADQLIVTATTANPTLVPLTNILLGGNGTNRAVQITPAANQSGSAAITLRVFDGAASNTSTFTLTVNATNDPPTLSAISDQTINQDSSTAAIAFTVSDAETTPASLTLARASSNSSLVPTNAIVFGGSGSARTVTVTPTTGRSGSALLTVTVSDGSASATDTFLLTVNPAASASNAPPTLAPIANRALNQNAGLQTIGLTGIGSGSANEIQTLSVSAASSNPALIPNPAVAYASPATTGTLTFTPVPGASGTATLSVFVTDGQPLNSLTSRTFTVTVNAAPLISPIPDQISDEDLPPPPIPFIVTDVETAAGSLTLLGSASDSNLVASITFGGAGSNRTVSVSSKPNQFGHSLITISVTDGDSNSATGSFEFIVNPINDPPTLNSIANISIGEDSGPRTVNLAGISSGAANETQPLSVTVVSSQPGLIPNPSVTYTSPGTTGSLLLAPSPNSNGVATLSVIVWDGQSQNGSVTQSFTVTVTATNDLPSISDVPNQLTSEDVPLVVGFVVADLETPADALTLTATSSDTNLVPATNITFAGSGSSRAAVIVPALNRSGTTTITLTVTDPAGATTSDSFVLTVDAVNDPPVISDITDQTVAEDGSTSPLNFVVSDPESAPDALTLGAFSSNPTLLPTNGITFAGSGSNRTITLTPAPNRSGTAVITLTVTDAGGLGSTDTFVLTVNQTSHPVIPPPVLTSIQRAGAAMDISFTTAAGFSYTLEFKNETTDTSWTPLPAVIGTGNVMTVTDGTGIVPRRVYRVRAD